MDAPDAPDLPGAPLEPVPARIPEPEPPWWARKEYAWPLSLGIGFAATWVGLVVPIPGLAALLAALGFLPLYRAFQLHGDLRFATYLGLGWMVGIAGAAVGLALEGQADLIVRRLPFGQRAVDLWIGPWLGYGGGPPGAASGSGWIEVGAFVGLGLALARPSRGALLLVVCALGVGMLAAAAAWVADRASRIGEPPLNAAAFGWPPAPLLALVGTWVAGSCLADPEPLRPWSAVRGWRKKALWAGVALAIGAACAQPLVQVPWGQWLQARVG